MRPPLLRARFDSELIIDSFAGGGGASLGIEIGAERHVDIAINHDPEAIGMHQENHPATRHYIQDVWAVDPYEACGNRRVGLLWLSPDCKHHSKAKGGKPRDKNIRGLSWVAIKWAKAVKPRLIILENVEEFAEWGPLGPDDRPDPLRKGVTFKRFVTSLRNLGYAVEWNMLRACDYGAPTIRRRLFLIARCDGLPIVWPDETHAEGGKGGLQPWRTAAECIDWTVPCPSIFTRERPLAPNTMRRIARGVVRYALKTPEPFIVSLTHHGGDRVRPLSSPMSTITAAHRGEKALVAPCLVARYGEREGQAPRTRTVEAPMPTIVPTQNGASLVTAFLAKHYGGHETPGWHLSKPMSTLTAQDHHALVTSHLINLKGSDRRDSPLTAPAPTVCAQGNHIGEVRAFLLKYYGTDQDPRLQEPLHTITSRDRFGLVTVEGNQYAIVDIGMRMLTPRELFNAQGFTQNYVIDHANGTPLTKTTQVRMVGNSVSPPNAAALVAANYNQTAMRQVA